MKHKKKLVILITFVAILVLFSSFPVFAAELTETDVEKAVAEQGKDAVTGNVFIWFLCAIAFLKVSQKIDSFMASLGINVGNTGGNMMAELLIAGRGISNALHHTGGGGSYRKPSSPGDAAVGGSFLAGGLAGSVGRHVERSAVNAATGYTENASIGNTLYQSSLQKGGDFANHVISNIAKGNYGQVGSIKGEDAANAYLSYMGRGLQLSQLSLAQHADAHHQQPIEHHRANQYHKHENTSGKMWLVEHFARELPGICLSFGHNSDFQNHVKKPVRISCILVAFAIK